MITASTPCSIPPKPTKLRGVFCATSSLPIYDVHDGWLIFEMPSADMGVHPTDPAQGPAANTHDISFFCDDIESTVAELKSRGVEFTSPVVDQGYGLVTHFKMPGDLVVQLYQPRYKKKPKLETRNQNQ